ncbi:MAG: transcriptional activator NhaR [Planctomycetes bacterium]|nr:transcriptional activator NhaR [Planctomycetota bacterium]
MNDRTQARVEWVNYHHLLYFWVVAREGGLVPAGKVLLLSHPTLSAQIHALEDHLGEKLFTKVGRKLALTDVGRVVFRYADEIFTLGREMIDTVKGRSTGQPVRLDVGVVDVVPKLVVRRLLQPALSLPEPVKIVCCEGSYEKLLADLALHTLDIVIADSPVPSGSSVRAFNHLLGETGVTLFGARSLASTFKRGFPQSLDGAPMVLPLESTALRRALNQWFDRQGVKPRVVAEIEDSALIKVFGADGVGIFAAPAVVQREVCRQYGVSVVGHAHEVRERFYAVSVERRLKHPAVVAISDVARQELFATDRPRA